MTIDVPFSYTISKWNIDFQCTVGITLKLTFEMNILIESMKLYQYSNMMIIDRFILKSRHAWKCYLSSYWTTFQKGKPSLIHLITKFREKITKPWLIKNSSIMSHSVAIMVRLVFYFMTCRWTIFPIIRIFYSQLPSATYQRRKAPEIRIIVHIKSCTSMSFLIK